MKKITGQCPLELIGISGCWTRLFQPFSLPEAPAIVLFLGRFLVINRLQLCSNHLPHGWTSPFECLGEAVIQMTEECSQEEPDNPLLSLFSGIEPSHQQRHKRLLAFRKLGVKGRWGVFAN